MIVVALASADPKKQKRGIFWGNQDFDDAIVTDAAEVALRQLVNPVPIQRTLLPVSRPFTRTFIPGFYNDPRLFSPQFPVAYSVPPFGTPLVYNAPIGYNAFPLTYNFRKW